MADQTEARVYGMADQANRHPPAAEGMRGAKTSTEPQRRDPELSHQVRLDSGKTVTVSEGSGTAFAEATGRAGLAEPKPWLAEAAWDEEAPPRGFSPVPLIAGLALAAGIIGLTLWRMRDRRQGWDIDFEPAADLAR